MMHLGHSLRPLAAVALLVGLAALQPAAVLAATDTVTVCDDSGAAGTLRNVIASAATGDTVNFSCSGTITLASTISLDKNLTIDAGLPDRLQVIGRNRRTLTSATLSADGSGMSW